ncbi:unnamed protein product [Rhizoctonia solani]|uniref:Pectinesterase n=1 Tax=Rhizoctonia solani TaxID=456999 RepID=A0A8H3CWE2_9AGAM|nr:unnamed protein product [Rhizoctonia solani]
MRLNIPFVLLVNFLSLISTAVGLTSPPYDAITVGTNGNYTCLNGALEDTSSDVYFIYAGTYTEQVVINRPNIKIYGQTSCNNSAYTSNQVTITNNVSASVAGNNDKSGTVRIRPAATGVRQVLQPLAGYQDTLYANRGDQFYGKNYIEGAVDFIFGQQASIWITGSTLNTIGSGFITASGRSVNDSTYYIIDNSNITGIGNQRLGRPWRSFARVIVQNSVIGPHVNTEGWSQWSNLSANTDNIFFGEYNNSGPGAWRTGCTPLAKKLRASIPISISLGNTSWIDPAYL